jgi:hypothetical protein
MGKAYSEYSRAPQLRYSEHVRGTRTDSSSGAVRQRIGCANGMYIYVHREREREAAYACALGSARACAGVWAGRGRVCGSFGRKPPAALELRREQPRVLPCLCVFVSLYSAHPCPHLHRDWQRDCARTGNRPCWDSPFSPNPFPV